MITNRSRMASNASVCGFKSKPEQVETFLQGHHDHSQPELLKPSEVVLALFQTHLNLATN